MAYAYLGQKLGFKVKLVVMPSMSQIRQNILKNYGAELIYSDPNLGFDGAIALTQKLIKEHPDQYYFPDQFNNPKNWEGHFKSTGPEIWNQTNGAITHFVAIMGTTGTFTGNGKFLKSKNPKVQLIEVQPDSNFHGIEGTRFLDATENKGFYDASLKDERILIMTEEAMSMAKKIKEQEGQWVGISAGANLAATLKVAEKLSSLPATPYSLVTIFCDSGERYADFDFWNDPSF
jgi:cysteine synthase B